MTYLIQVAMADGKLTAGEIEVMQKLGEKLDVPHQEFQKLITQVREML
jgi:uncharacterized tellurite resistance protein B-like protein